MKPLKPEEAKELRCPLNLRQKCFAEECMSWAWTEWNKNSKEVVQDVKQSDGSLRHEVIWKDFPEPVAGVCTLVHNKQVLSPPLS